MDDKDIIALLFDRSENAIAGLAEKYGVLCKSVALNILGDSMDAEECVNDAYLGVWDAIPPERPSSLCAFVCGIVRNLSLNRAKFNKREKRDTTLDSCLDEMESFLASPSSVDEALDEKVLVGYKNEYLRTQSVLNRMIFIRRFWYMESYETVAKTAGLREGSVRTRASRVKAGLKGFLKTKGVTI